MLLSTCYHGGERGQGIHAEGWIADCWHRNIEDYVTWVDSSKIKRNILKYRDKVDDFDLL